MSRQERLKKRAAAALPTRIEIPQAEHPRIAGALQRMLAGEEQVRAGEEQKGIGLTELENVKLRLLLAAGGDQPELWKVDVTSVPFALVRVEAAGPRPSSAVPVEPPAQESQTPDVPETPDVEQAAAAAGGE